FRRRLVRQGEDTRLVIGIAVEVPARTGPSVRIAALAEAPARFLAIHHRPAQPARLVIGLKRRQIMAVIAAKLRILLEQPLLYIETEGLRLVVLEFRVGLAEREFVDLAVRIQNVKQRLAPVFGPLGDEVSWPDVLNLEAL